MTTSADTRHGSETPSQSESARTDTAASPSETIYSYNPALDVRAVPQEGVYFLDDRGNAVRADGRFVRELHARLLEGVRASTVDEIVGALADGPTVRDELGRMVKRRLVVRCTPQVLEQPANTYWEQAGYPVLDVDRRDFPAVAIMDLTGGDSAVADRLADELVATLPTVLPATVSAERVPRVIVCNRLTDDAVLDWNRRALAESAAWIGFVPFGARPMVTGVFSGHEQSACCRCLEYRMNRNDLVAPYVDAHAVSRPARGAAAAGASMGGALVANRIVRHVFGADQPLMVTAIDSHTADLSHHRVIRRPQCPACGDRDAVARSQDRRPVFVSEPVSATDGGYRAASAENVLEELSTHVSEVCGTVRTLVPATPKVTGLHVFYSGQNLAVPYRNLSQMRAGLRTAAAGKGSTESQARASAIGEAMERYCGVFDGDESMVRASLTDLGSAALTPNDIALYSDSQFSSRNSWNARGTHYEYVPERYDGRAIDWTPVWPIAGGDRLYVPTSAAFYNYRSGPVVSSADSNGAAAGGSLTEAALQGLFELIERDSVAIWWYNRLSMPEVPIEALDDPALVAWRRIYAKMGRKYWLLDLTSDIDVSTIAAISMATAGDGQRILMGFGTHLDPRIAASRAVAEMNQFVSGLLSYESSGSRTAFDVNQVKWWETATVQEYRYLTPGGARSPRAFDIRARFPTVGAALDAVVERLAARGLSAYLLDQSRPDVPLSVVKTFVPGLYHFWPRFAPGRLYDVPVRIGALQSPTKESDLNPVSMFL